MELVQEVKMQYDEVFKCALKHNKLSDAIGALNGKVKVLGLGYENYRQEIDQKQDKTVTITVKPPVFNEEEKMAI